MNRYSLALEARARWAMYVVSLVGGKESAAKTAKSLAIIGAERSGQAAGRDDEDVRCPALLADVEELRDAFTRAMLSVRELRQKRRTRDGIAAEVEAMAKEANRRCGLSYELFVKWFSEDVEGLLEELEPEYRPLALEIAKVNGYATSEERHAMQDEIEESGGCPLTGIDPWCCPCGRHE
ncbi:hypothetical protein BX589_14924 [Paraburkholderia fungorum]|nr:hypothetical protein [Burkholderia multivorans]PRZ43844.1 hypothetical protein BX589_14924 [Paraburkholderia fungorum]